MPQSSSDEYETALLNAMMWTKKAGIIAAEHGNMPDAARLAFAGARIGDILAKVQFDRAAQGKREPS